MNMYNGGVSCKGKKKTRKRILTRQGNGTGMSKERTKVGNCEQLKHVNPSSRANNPERVRHRCGHRNIIQKLFVVLASKNTNN